MKKIFTLIAAAMMAVCASAQDLVEIPIESAEQWSSGWKATVTYSNGIIYVENDPGEYGAAALWLGEADWSMYSSVSFVVESCTGGWGQIVINDVDGGTTTAGISSTNVQKTFTCDISNLKSKVKQLCLQSSPESKYSFSRVYLTPKVEFEAAKELLFDEWNNIYASEFRGLSDFAKIVFTFETEGELVNDEGKDVTNWGTGAIQSCDGAVKVLDVPAAKIGTHTLTFTLMDLKNALNSGPSQYDTYGLNLYFYAQGHSTTKLVKVEAYQEKGFDGPGYQEPSSTSGINEIATKKNADIMYNIAGQRVQNAKGLVIKNGKKMIF